MTSIPLSVLDQSPVRQGGTAADAINETLALAKCCEEWGYYRYWVAEHHATGGLAGCSPEVLLSRLGAETKSIRIGSGGVMLPHYSPYKVAENFKLLSTMYPGRVDLGVGRAPGSNPFINSVLAYGSQIGAEYFPQMVGDLDALLRDVDPLTPGMEKARAYPRVDIPPALWMLGSSNDSAKLAASMGLPYCFAYFINSNIGSDIFATYRDNFIGSDVAEKPYSCLCPFVICANTDAEAERLYKSRELWYLRLLTQNESGGFPSVEEAENYQYSENDRALLQANPRHIVKGSAQRVKDELLEMAEKFAVDELMIVSITYDFDSRCRSYELLAEAWAS
ncbi:MAG: LLM class flavin-dependent oxidoreductase [Gammaproteobacteria bacterium]|jgi:luciferase family oxidoreductase group 1|nr:LLM class flavin-dependent oxidoreductase [Gammaproteobacteria bacterium]